MLLFASQVRLKTSLNEFHYLFDILRDIKLILVGANYKRHATLTIPLLRGAKLLGHLESGVIIPVRRVSTAPSIIQRNIL